MRDPTNEPTVAGLQAENAELRMRLEEAEEALRAIREGEVDAVIVSGSRGDRVFSLTGTENLHRLMVETMSEAGLAISQDGLLLYGNRCAAALLQRPRDELLGHRLHELVAPQDAERLRALVEASSQGTADDRIVFCAADGSAVPLHLWASRLERPGEPTICLVGTDLTRLEADRAQVAQLVEQQREICASRAEALDLMAQAVAAREQAAQSARELQESDRRKDAFLATLAHELRNPLAPIRNALEILRLSGTNGPLAMKAQEIMERQVAHLVRLVDDLLEVSRITRGKIDLRKEPVDLVAVLTHAAETARAPIGAARQHLELDLPSEPLWLQADPVRLTQIFGNLLNNATKFTGPGGEIRVAARLVDHTIRVSVRDTGVGIPAELLPRVFDLFQQGDPCHSPVQGGLGIGLSLVKSLVELHGGRVEAQSPGPGLGSELLVQLPLTPGETLSPGRPWTLPRPPAHAASHAPASPAPTEGLRILIVDDNRDAANSLATLLALRGAAVQVAYDGPSALETLDRERPALAILDIGMPGMDGHEVARQIRARPDCRHIRLVAMTGRCQEIDRRQSLTAGFDLHLVKPVSPGTLDALVADLRDRIRGTRDLSMLQGPS